MAEDKKPEGEGEEKPVVEEKKTEEENGVKEDGPKENGEVEEEEPEVPDPDKPEGIVDYISCDIKDCPVLSVVVYLDRAEVCRTLKHTAKRGDNEFILKNLSNAIDKESIRVEGKGAATISEVTLISKHISSDQDDSNSKAAELEKEIREKRREKKVMTDTQARLRKQRDVLDGVANNIMLVGETKDKDGNAVPMCSMLDSKMVEGIQGFFNMYDTQAERLDKSLQQLEVDVEKLDQEIIATEKNLYKLKSGRDECLDRECSIIVDVKKDDDIELVFSYVVTKAKWSPKYDIRVFSKDTKMKLMYFGVVEQSTGEEWGDTKLCLSTASPSIGGQVPALGTYQLSLKAKSHRKLPFRFASMRRLKEKTYKSRSEHESLEMCAADADMLVAYEPRVLDDSYITPPKPEMEYMESKIKEGISSTTFEIARKCTIPSDGQGHRVSIGIINLSPTFEYESVPKKGARAYLKAKVKNTSEYALLQGPANIFLDNNFIAKSELKSVSPDEEFTCSLGVDPAVRVDYRPIHKYREQTGIISKNISMVYTQKIEVKNTRSDAIRLTVSEQLPQSTEEKIKVKLVEPNLKEERKAEKEAAVGGAAGTHRANVKLNKWNNIEWEGEIPAGESREYVLKYTIDHPLNEDIETTVAGVEGETTV